LAGSAPHTPTFAVPRDRLRPGERSKLAGLLTLIVLWATPATADDLIEKWLRQDESSGQVDVVRQDLNALTNEEWRDIFDIGNRQPDAELSRRLSRELGREVTLGQVSRTLGSLKRLGLMTSEQRFPPTPQKHQRHRLVFSLTESGIVALTALQQREEEPPMIDHRALVGAH